MNIVNKVLGGLYQSTPGYQIARGADQMRSEGVSPLSTQGLQDPRMRNPMFDIAMGMSTGPVDATDKWTPEMIEKVLKRNSNTYKPRVSNKDVWGDEEGKRILDQAMRVIMGNYK